MFRELFSRDAYNKRTVTWRIVVAFAVGIIAGVILSLVALQTLVAWPTFAFPLLFGGAEVIRIVRSSRKAS